MRGRCSALGHQPLPYNRTKEQKDLSISQLQYIRLQKQIKQGMSRIQKLSCDYTGKLLTIFSLLTSQSGADIFWVAL